MKRAAISVVVLAILASGFLFFVVPFQRSLFLIATTDVEFYDGIDETKVVYVLSSGGSAVIVRCEDKKTIVEPAIKLTDRTIVFVKSGRFEINRRPTGIFSWPQYLGCPGL
jgi:hypothetical protein